MNATEMYFIKGAEAYNTGKGEEGQVGIQVIDPQTLKVTLEHPVSSIKQNWQAHYSFHYLKIN